MKKISAILALLFLTFNPCLAAGAKEGGEPENLAQIVTTLQDTYQRINDFQAKFDQAVEFKDFENQYVSKGTLFLKKGRMRWDYTEPSLQQIFVQDDKFLYYIPEHQQAIISRLGGQSDTHLPLQLLAGTGKLEQEFQVTLEEGTTPGRPPYSLRLTPKKPKMGLTKLVATLSSTPHMEGLIIQKIVLFEENGNISTFKFDNIQINKGFKDDVFSFKIPKGVDVIEAP